MSEGVLCERWDSRRGSVRRPLPYRAQREESMHRKQKLAATSRYYGAINILSGYPPAEYGRCSQGKANRHKTIPLRAGMSYFSDCGTTIFSRENFAGSHECLRRAQSNGPRGNYSCRMLKKVRPTRPQASRNRRRYPPHFVRPFARTMDPGERINPSSTSTSALQPPRISIGRLRILISRESSWRACSASYR
jgi:hypothetical protein